MKTTGDAYVDRARSTPHEYSPGPGGRCNDCRLTRNSPIHRDK